MNSTGTNIYILKLTDEHHTENIHPRYRSLEYLTGFTGSYGKALVFAGLQECLATHNRPYLFTDSRYYIQAKKQLVAPWELIYELEGTLINVLNTIFQFEPCYAHYAQKQNKLNLYVDPEILTIAFYRDLEMIVDNFSDVLQFHLVKHDFVQAFWPSRPAMPSSEVFVHELKYAGESASSKIMKIRKDLLAWGERDKKLQTYADDVGLRGVFVVELDDIAWILNLRGSDTEFSPMFYAYLYIDVHQTVLWINTDRPQFQKIKDYLHTMNVKIEEYDKSVIHKFLAEKYHQRYYIYCDMVKYDLYSVLKERVYTSDLYEDYRHLPVKIKYYKSVRNKVSLLGEKNANLKDSIALVRYLSWLSSKVRNNEPVTEWEGVVQLEEYKKVQGLYFGKAFDSISASGANAAMAHYMPNSDEHDVIRKQNMYLLDQGSNYLDGTTDITRTIAFVEKDQVPLEWKTAYTQVLKGNISLLTQSFSRDTPMTTFDTLGDQYLPSDVTPGTVGHGIGHFLTEHEFPPGTWYDFPIYENQVISDEPSLEREGKYGIRIEDDLVCRYLADNESHKINSKDKALHVNTTATKYFVMDNMTLVPFHVDLIHTDMLTPSEIQYINTYHDKVYHNLVSKLYEQADTMAVAYLTYNTQKIQHKILDKTTLINKEKESKKIVELEKNKISANFKKYTYNKDKHEYVKKV